MAYRDNSNLSQHLYFLLIPDLQYPSDERILPGIKLDTVKELFQNVADCESRINYLLIFDKRSLMRRVRLSRFFICSSCNRLSRRAMSGGDHGINVLCFNAKKRKYKRTCVKWNGNDHDCYPNKCCPSQKIIQGGEGQSNLGRSGTRNTNLNRQILPELVPKLP